MRSSLAAAACSNLELPNNPDSQASVEYTPVSLALKGCGKNFRFRPDLPAGGIGSIGQVRVWNETPWVPRNPLVIPTS